MILCTHTILFVADLARSRDFYALVLDRVARLDVPGMVEFELGPGQVLGLMPRAGAERILGQPLSPEGTRHELYLYVDQPTPYVKRALEAGATVVSPGQVRNWGDWAAYLKDLDGHLLVVAQRGVLCP